MRGRHKLAVRPPKGHGAAQAAGAEANGFDRPRALRHHRAHLEDAYLAAIDLRRKEDGRLT